MAQTTSEQSSARTSKPASAGGKPKAPRTRAADASGGAADGAGANGVSDLTIEQLAAAVGMSVRNIRNHHTRGLLPPPEVRARVGYYDAEHVARLRLILDLQADGFNLAAIERLLSGSNGLAERLSGLRRAVTTPFEPEQPELITAGGPAQGFGASSQ